MNEEITTIKPKSRLNILDIKEIVQYRELLFALTNRDFKIRYKQTLLGVAWAILQPVVTMIVFTVFFGNIADINTGGIPYPIFSYAGLLIWLYFSNTISNIGSSLVTNSQLVSKVYFPRIFIPISTTLTGLIDYALALVILFVLYAVFSYTITIKILLIPFVLLLVWLLTVGLGLWLSALNVRYRDIKYIIPFIMQIMLFVTPIIYPVSVATNFKNILMFNPMTGIVEAHRSLLLGSVLDPLSLLISIGVTLFILITGIIYFRKTEKTFADLI